MNIITFSIFVSDQEKAKEFYTNILGFEVKHDIDLGGAKWLTVKEANSQNPVEILLEPNDNKIAKNYQNGLFESKIPATMFSVNDLQKTYSDLVSKGVEFITPPKKVNDIYLAIFNDTVGNLIQLVEQYE
ncbi:VOC family protein [Mammaliicoccus sciuri]|uniref:VOC family protein n=1 Tax=Mammaliicoccus sciuri TaxID=1296 RepID=UPI002DBC5438|nr:VOC family protein [Mammaliicoccus sciuri]MEB7784232.1 VOC family protein [Mammaliicoccus sciuri]